MIQISRINQGQGFRENRYSQDVPTELKQCVMVNPGNRRLPQEKLCFHRDYLIQRVQDTQYAASGPELFKEIQARGYRGSLKSVQQLLWTVRRSKRPVEATLAFHQNYLSQRMKETGYGVSGPQLFKEIQAKGYRGTVSTVRSFLSTIRRSKRPVEATLAFHQNYLFQRMRETEHRASGSQLFKEIQARGYQGAASTVRRFLSAIRRNGRPPEACLTFHQDYLAEKIEGENQSRHGSASQIFKDIWARGYRGSISHLRKKLMLMRRETVLKRTRAEGYLGSIKTVQNFLTMTQPAKRLYISPF